MSSIASIIADVIAKTYDPANEYTQLYYTNPETAMGYRFGVITDIKDPDGLGRVKVHLPAINDHAVSDWAPVLRPYSSDTSGLWYLPQIDDRVYCGFINNKPEMPVVLGFLYTNECKPPVEQDDENNIKVIVSPKGTRIELIDKSGEERISIASKDEKMVLQIDETSGILIKNEEGDIDITCKEFTCGGGGTGTLAFEEELSMEAEKDILIDAKETLACQAVKEAQFKSGEKIKLIGSGGVTAGMMQMAAKDDRVLGLDIHKEVVPVGTGTVDVPFPHPFIAALVDELSEDVLIGDKNAAFKGSIAKNDPPHIIFPPGIKFSQDPENEGKVEKDTVKDVLINGKEAAVFLSIVKECSDMSFPFVGESFVITPGIPMLSVLRNILLNVNWALLEGVLAAAGVALGAVLDMICQMLGSTLDELLSSVKEIADEVLDKIFPEFSNLAWYSESDEKVTKTETGTPVKLSGDVSNLEDGEIVELIIYEKGTEDIESNNIKKVNIEVKDSKLEYLWDALYVPEERLESLEKDEKLEYQFCFNYAEEEIMSEPSPLCAIVFCYTLNIKTKSGSTSFNDAFVLKSTDSAETYSQKLKSQDDSTPDDGKITLKFEEIPAGFDYTLEQVPEGKSKGDYVFQDKPFSSLIKLRERDE